VSARALTFRGRLRAMTASRTDDTAVVGGGVGGAGCGGGLGGTGAGFGAGGSGTVGASGAAANGMGSLSTTLDLGSSLTSPVRDTRGAHR
jgi:hypothetical protein